MSFTLRPIIREKREVPNKLLTENVSYQQNGLQVLQEIEEKRLQKEEALKEEQRQSMISGLQGFVSSRKVTERRKERVQRERELAENETEVRSSILRVINEALEMLGFSETSDIDEFFNSLISESFGPDTEYKISRISDSYFIEQLNNKYLDVDNLINEAAHVVAGKMKYVINHQKKVLEEEAKDTSVRNIHYRGNKLHGKTLLEGFNNLNTRRMALNESYGNTPEDSRRVFADSIAQYTVVEALNTLQVIKPTLTQVNHLKRQML